MIEEQDCRKDTDCAALEICLQDRGQNRCVDPCSTLRPCVTNAECRVHSTTPTRTMSCICFEGFTGNGREKCEPIGTASHFLKQLSHLLTILLSLVAPIEVGCSSDNECPNTQACRNRACVNPCGYDSPCSSTAECVANNHQAICKCPPGLTGDPYSLCVPSKFLQNTLIVAKASYFFLSQNWRVSA